MRPPLLFAFTALLVTFPLAFGVAASPLLAQDAPVLVSTEWLV